MGVYVGAELAIVRNEGSTNAVSNALRVRLNIVLKGRWT